MVYFNPLKVTYVLIKKKLNLFDAWNRYLLNIEGLIHHQSYLRHAIPRMAHVECLTKNFQLSDGFLMILWFNVVKENPKEAN